MISRSLKHISNAVTNPTNWFVAACFAVCLFSTMRLLDSRTILISQTADAAEVAADNSAHLQTNSELDAAKTLGLDSIVSSDGSLSASVKSKTVLTPIEELEVGMRVRADSPNGEFDDQFGTEVIPSKWRKLTLTSPKKNGTLSHITLLRPLDWIEREKAVVDGQVYITVPECGIDGNARVHSIEPCPEIPDGEGQVITGTFQHQAEGGMELTIEGEPEPIRCTGNHPFWSEDRQSFIRADSVGIGASVSTSNALRTVVGIQELYGTSTIHNIEVLGTHVYRVGKLGTLVHNGDECPGILALSLKHLVGDFTESIEEVTGTRVFTYWDYFKNARDMSQLEDRLDTLMDTADEIHVNISEMSHGGRYQTIDDLVDAGMAGAFDGNVTNWEVWWALENFGDKVKWWQNGENVTEELFDIFLD